MQVADGGIRVRTGDAIGGQAQVRLELAQGKLGERAEDAVDVAAGEAERGERLLQLLHVMTVEMGHAQVQRAVAQAKRCVHQGSPRFLVHLFAALELRLGAESGNCLRRFRPEQAVDASLVQKPDTGETVLHVLDGSSGIVEFNGFHCTHLLQSVHEPIGHGDQHVARQGRPHLFHQAALRGIG